MSVGLKQVNRKEKTDELIVHQLPKFRAAGIIDPFYVPKCAHYVKGQEGKFMGFFKSELSKGVDIYTECVDFDINSEDPSRTLYKIKYNPFYEEEYLSEPTKSGDNRYLIPLTEMIPIIMEEEPVVEKSTGVFPDFEASFLDTDTDTALAQMSVRDFAAIMWKKPVSNKKWLNELIKTV